jgi:hypothetical protein
MMYDTWVGNNPNNNNNRKERIGCSTKGFLKLLVLSLIIVSILIVLYVRIWSTSIGLFSPSIAVIKITTATKTTTQSIHNIRVNQTIVVAEITEEDVDVDVDEDEDDDPELIISSASCLWNPIYHNSNCPTVLEQHMSSSLNRSRTLYLLQYQQQNNTNDRPPKIPSVLHRRWLLLGDSTVFRLFKHLRQFLMNDSVQRYQQYWSKQQQQQCHQNESDISTENNYYIKEDFSCLTIQAGRCNTMEQLHLPRLPTTQPWVLPNFTMGEGPMKFGYENPYCTDCNGCDSQIISCQVSNDGTIENCPPVTATATSSSNDSISTSYIGPSYGGYLSVEFARDVELQTLKHRTTQENFLSMYIAHQWNQPSTTMILEFGRPICVVSTGHHDVAIPNITLQVYLQNVQWYLELLIQQCDYIIWISNNCPATDDYHQTTYGTYEWNVQVRDLLLLSKANRSIRSNIFFLDVFNASQTFPHDDNIHMSIAWYQKLSSFLQTIMQNLIL